MHYTVLGYRIVKSDLDKIFPTLTHTPECSIQCKKAEGRYAEIAGSTEITGTDAECVEKLCDKLDECNIKLNIPKSLKEFGVKESEFKEKVGEIRAGCVYGI